MDSLYTRLVVLGYPLRDAHSKKPTIYPMHFAVDLSSMGTIAGSQLVQLNQQLQYQKFVDVALWLLRQLGTTAIAATASVDVRSDAPLTVVKQLLLIAQVCLRGD